ncbi:MAG: elongation factor EF-2 [Candidatus Thermoplasmatota archaeon]|nr:elongation factor EF-2 [Candidatus Thermoplasmatota archaeon]
MGRKEELIKKVQRLRNELDNIRNIGTAAHIDHGKTTLSDNLLAGAGMISEELAGKQLFLDYDEQEQARGITINAANASMVHEYGGKECLINLIDTPGHVDFGGDVTRAMRALDGVILVDCAVEGIMPQTETVIRQAMKEKVKPILFINKTDRLITELRLNPEQMQERFRKIITGVNELIRKYAPEEFKDQWLVKVEDGSVCFGSAYHKWGISAPFMKKTGVTFKDIYEYCTKNMQKELSEKAPLHEVVLDAVVKHLPPPTVAQKYRVPTIWKGDINSEVGKGMLACSSDAPLSLMITKIIMDPHVGEVAIGRIYSGSIRKGQKVRIVGMPREYTAQQVAISVGADRLPIEELNAGNIVAVTGIEDAAAGVTITNCDMEPFEKITHYSEPVVTVAIEAKHATDLPKLVNVLRTVAKADPSLQVEINQETGEHLLSGMGELHLEITEYRITHDHKVEIEVSKPIVVYRESTFGQGGPFEGKSPNKHNKFYLTAEPLEKEVVDAILRGEIKAEDKIKDSKALAKKLQELGLSKEDSKNVRAFHKTNVFIDATWGIQYLHETMELCVQAFHEVMERGPLANEKCMGVKIKLVDAKLHEDSIHRGPAQVIPAVRNAICGAMCQAQRILLEPRQKVFINVPPDVMGDVTREMQQRRATIEDIKQEGDLVTVISNAPVAEMFGFATSIRSATGGKVLWSTEHAGFERVPKELQSEVVRKIRERKGLKPEPYDEVYYAS